VDESCNVGLGNAQDVEFYNPGCWAGVDEDDVVPTLNRFANNSNLDCCEGSVPVPISPTAACMELPNGHSIQRHYCAPMN
jgi:hypothetical protein